MTTLLKNLNRIFTSAVLVAILILAGCGDDDGVSVTPTSNTKTYTLAAVADPGISGTATFTELSDGTIEIELALNGTPDGGIHPAHIHANTAAEGGGIVVSLESVDGTTGTSTTIISMLDDGTTVSYGDLLNFDGYINVHLSADELSTLVAQGDIGQNELTGTSKAYDLNEAAVAGISGTATFYERVNGEALAELVLANTPDGGSHPAHIHNNTAVEGGGIAFTFNAVDGTSGSSKTNIAALDDGTTITYSGILNFDGYINVHLSSDDLGTLVAQGDIGQNELTGTSKTYELNQKDVDGISGTATFYERQNGESLAEIALVNTPDGGSHPAHIHANSAAEGGGIVFTFSPVDGSSGVSLTNVAALDDGTPLTYTGILDFDGYINVHLSAEELGTIVAQGNIGSNEGSTQAINYDVTNSGSSAYIFNGNGLTNAQNPNLTLTRGMTYTFTVNASGHPFFINSSQGTGTGNAYSNGVTNNGVDAGTVTFTVPNDAPGTLFYNCQFHSPMTGTITIVD